MRTAGAAFDAFEPAAKAVSATQSHWQAGDNRLPSLFLSHGAPPLFDMAQWMDDLFTWSHSMKKPAGIVIISAHWESTPISVSAPNPATGLVYDFGGFDPRYYQMQYSTPDASDLGTRVTGLLSSLGTVHELNRGLDHGAWVPLKVMYPLADIPVVQVSLPTHNPQRLLSMGNKLAELRDEGVLIIGSGFMTHGLPFITREMMQGSIPGWSRDFDAWAWQALEEGNVEELSRYLQKAPGMPYSHPTVEHFTPLFVTLGAGSDLANIRTKISGAMWGLSKRSIELD